MPINRPTESELIEAVVEFLQGEVLPQLNEPGLAYKAKVALNSLNIAARQSLQGDFLAQFESVLLGRYLNAEGSAEELNALLIDKIREGEVDSSDAVLLDVLTTLSLNKLAIDNPRYSTFKKYRPE